MLPQPKALHGINQGIILTVVRSGTDDFIFKDFTFGSYTHSTSEPSALSLRVTVVGRKIFIFFGRDGLKIGKILRLKRLTPFPLRMTV